MKRYLFTSVMWLLLLTTHAQSICKYVVCSSGETFSNSSFKLDWTIGEIQTETFKTTQSLLTQGFQQGRECITDVHELKTGVQARLFPNPVKDILNVELNFEGQFDNMEYKITDMTGRQIIYNRMDRNSIQIDMSDLKKGIYILSINHNKQTIKLYQLIKN